MPPMTIGLDVGSFSVKRVRLRSGLRSLEIIDAKTAPIARDDRPRRERVAEALATLGPGGPGDICAVALPGDEVLLRALSLPFADRKRIEQTLGFELESQLPFGLNEVVYDYQISHTSRSGSRLLAAVCPRENLAGWLKLLADAGYDPRLLGHDALALTTLLGWQELGPEEQYGVLDIGHELTSVALVRAEKVVFARTISGGGKEMVELLSAAYRLNAEEVLARLKGASLQLSAAEGQAQAGAELDQLIRRAFSQVVRSLRQTLAAARQLTGEKPKRLWLSGGASAVGGLEKYMSEQLELEVSKLPPPPIAGVEKLATEGQAGFGGYARALGLALHAHQGGRRGWLNLRRGPFAYQGNFELARGRVLQIALTVVILLVLAAGQALVRYLSLKSTAAEIDRQTQQITKTILGKTYSDLDVALAVMRDNLSPANDPLPRVSALDVLREIHQRIPSDVVFRLKEINISPKRLQLTAFTDTFEAVEKIRNELGKFECFGEIQTGKTQKSTSGDEVEFSFTIVFGC